MTKLSILSALLILTTSPVAAANAPRSQTVSYRDLDLTRSEGRATLEGRINRAVRAVCEPPAGTTGLTEMAEVQSCIHLTRLAARHMADLAVLRARGAAAEMQLSTR